MKEQALLVFDDGTCFTGFACGARGEASGEVVFTTGMAGWQETLTDPSYRGQIISFTAAHPGNYGANAEDNEAAQIQAAGAIFHDLFLYEQEGPNSLFPHWAAEESLDTRLKRDGITGIYGVDTRALTLHLRKHGARNGVISSRNFDVKTLRRKARSLPLMQGRDLACEAGCSVVYQYVGKQADNAGKYCFGGRKMESIPTTFFKVAVLDLGVKRSILNSLWAAGLEPTVWPAATPAETLLASCPDGILLSNGPGDPEPCCYAVDAVRQLLGKVPLFGICLGHQILSLALGGKTYKLPFGHHGVNHPVKDLRSGRVWVTSQNHGFCVDPDSLPATVELSHINLNDQTLEGLACRDLPAFSVQFHPEAGPGPYDAAELFSRFRESILSFKRQRP